MIPGVFYWTVDRQHNLDGGGGVLILEYFKFSRVLNDAFNHSPHSIVLTLLFKNVCLFVFYFINNKY